MTAVLMTPPYLQFFDDDGAPLAGGKVYTYTATGTFTVPKATYTTAAGTIEQDNPIILDASGRPTLGNGSIWLSGTYDFKVTDSLDNIIETTLGVTAFTTLPESSPAYFQSFSGTGAQTAFTTSSDLGTDEKAIFVWVDAGAGKGYDIQSPTAYTINGTALSFNSAPAVGTGNIYVSAPSLLVGAASSAAADAAASAAAALASEMQAGAYAGQLIVTSTTSIAIGTGSKVFTVASGLSLSAGQFILITSNASPSVNYMWGTIASYSSTTLTVTVATTGGSGTLADWTMYLTGARGTTGATGSINDLSGVPTATIATGDYVIFEDVSDSNLTKRDTVGAIILAAQKANLPIGSYYFNETDATNPATLLGFGTWTAITDKFIVAHGSTYTTTGGAATAALTATNIPTITGNLVSNSGAVYNADNATGASVSAVSLSVPGTNTKNTILTTSTNTSGSSTGTAFSIIPPYQAAYVWKRTA